jgi:histidinol-phosphate phosphatase family protein
LREVEHDMLSGKVARMNRRFPRPAIFLDRDGVLNRDSMEHIPTPAALELLPRVAEAVQRINRSDYLAVCVTNQPMIAKGFASEADLAAVHAKLEHELGAAGAYLDRIYYCPHHPDRGFAGERPELKIACDCRKPNTGMIERAAADMHIDLSKSWIIGDRTVDIECARRARLRSILVRTGAGGSDRQYECKPQAIVDDLWEAVEMTLEKGVGRAV